MLELVIYHQKIMTGLKWFWQVELEVRLKLSKVNASFLPFPFLFSQTLTKLLTFMKLIKLFL